MTKRKYLTIQENNDFFHAIKKKDIEFIKQCVKNNWAMPISQSWDEKSITGLGAACRVDGYSLESVKILIEDMNYKAYFDIAECVSYLLSNFHLKKDTLVIDYLLNPEITQHFDQMDRMKIINVSRYDVPLLNKLAQFDFPFTKKTDRYFIEPAKLSYNINYATFLYEMGQSSGFKDEYKLLLSNADSRALNSYFLQLIKLNGNKSNLRFKSMDALTGMLENKTDELISNSKLCRFYSNRDYSLDYQERATYLLKNIEPVVQSNRLQNILPNKAIKVKSLKI